MTWEKILKEDESVEEEEFVHYIKAEYGDYLAFDYIYDGKKVNEEIAHTISWLAHAYSEDELTEVYDYLIGMGYTIKLREERL